MAKPRNLRDIVLAGSAAAGLAGCDDLVGAEVERPGHIELDTTRALYNTALYSGLALCGIYLAYKWIKKEL